MKAVQDDIQPDRHEEAALWCMSLAEGQLPPGEREAFDRWLEDDRNAAAFQAVVRTWKTADSAACLPEAIAMRSAALESYRTVNRQRWTRRLGARSWWAGGIAATLVLAVTTLFMLSDSTRPYQTEVGERRVALLDDQSRLSLDADSLVEVDMSDQQRELTLVRGRAKFDVAKDPLRPFTVVAGDKMVVATGTSFSVEMIGGEVRVLLYHGRVSVLDRTAPAPAGKELQLKPGQEMIAPVGAGAPPTLVSFDPERSSSWESGQLSFGDEPLALAAARMNRYSDRKLALGDAKVARVRVNGVFTAGDTAAFVEGVTRMNAVRAEYTPGQITLKSQPEKK